ncbi:MAG TPA: polysaccharide deacetylase family protein [Candidatus Acidoferrum sp.]|nr:polysaccharide deacetylase family protein [Candidatus Acidoferrum sp.]
MDTSPWLIGTPALIAAAAGVTAFGAAYPRAQLFGNTICRTNAARKLAITFDDGPNPAITPKLLDLLDQHKARASFFLIGGFAKECPELAREIVARGHEVGNHTDTHENLFWRSPEQIRNELLRCSETIAELLGKNPEWFRPPYGFRNPWVVPMARRLGMKTVMWTLIPGDWREKPAEWLIRRMEPIAKRREKSQSAEAGTGDVLCLHDGGHRGLNADRTRTLAALEYWLPRWSELGLEFVTISEAVSAAAL